jgi:hypothetical protein
VGVRRRASGADALIVVGRTVTDAPPGTATGVTAPPARPRARPFTAGAEGAVARASGSRFELPRDAADVVRGTRRLAPG